MLDLKSQYNSIKTEIDEAIQNVINDCAFINGKYVKKFEEEFASYIGMPYCIGVGNGTDALEIAIEALHLPKGSEIIVPANTFIASAEAVTRTGHTVVFCDCTTNNYTIDIKSLRLKISEKTRAIIVVHLYGHPCDMDEIRDIAEKCGIRIVEDCAQAHGAEYKGEKIGTFGDIATFSFYPGKNLGAYGDGGAVLTKNKNLASEIRMIGNHGRIDKYDHEFEGRNSRLDGLQAAILSVKLRHLDDWIQKRIEIANFYFEYLRDIDYIKLPEKEDYAKHSYHLFVVQAENRDKLRDFLYSNGVETGVHYPIALPKLRAYSYLKQQEEDFDANKIDRYLLSLPMGEHLGKADVFEISKFVKRFYSL